MLTRIVKEVVKNLSDGNISFEELKEALWEAHDEVKWDAMQAVTERAVSYLAESSPGRGVNITITEESVVISCGTSRKPAHDISAGLFNHLRNRNNDTIEDNVFTVNTEDNQIIITFHEDFIDKDLHPKLKRDHY